MVQKGNLHLTVNRMIAIEEERAAADRPRGFAKGSDPERKIGATASSGELMLLRKWKDLGTLDAGKGGECDMKCPQIVIAFIRRN